MANTPKKLSRREKWVWIAGGTSAFVVGWIIAFRELIAPTQWEWAKALAVMTAGGFIASFLIVTLIDHLGQFVAKGHGDEAKK